MTAIIRNITAQDAVLEPVRLGKKLSKVVPLIALVIGLLGYFTYEFSPVFGGDLVRDIVPQGRVVAADSPTLYAMDSGTIDLHIKAGDEVERSQVLAQIISPALNEELQRERSNLQRLNIELEGTRIQSERRKLELQQREEIDKEQRRAEAAFKMQIISSSKHYIELEGTLIQSELRKFELQQREEIAGVNLKAMDREQRRTEAAFKMQIISISKQWSI